MDLQLRSSRFYREKILFNLVRGEARKEVSYIPHIALRRTVNAQFAVEHSGAEITILCLESIAYRKLGFLLPSHSA